MSGGEDAPAHDDRPPDLEADLTARIAAAPRTWRRWKRCASPRSARPGSISGLLKSLGAMSPDERRVEGPAINGLRDRVAAAIAARKAALEDAGAGRASWPPARLDLSLPAPPRRKGSVHPTMQVMDEMVAIFAEMGFARGRRPGHRGRLPQLHGPQLPAPPPGARDARHLLPEARTPDGERKLLRTHTSPIQVRVMRRDQRRRRRAAVRQRHQAPPIRIIGPGRVYRCDSDATHTPMFHQMEGLVIDRDIHMGHLKWTLDAFVAPLLRDSTASSPASARTTSPSPSPRRRWTCSATAPAARSRSARATDWLEILGGGMVHPNILRICGLDPDEWQGFAFGLGVDRLAMLKYGMPDLRDMFAADARWLAHYGFSAFAAPNPATGLS